MKIAKKLISLFERERIEKMYIISMGKGEAMLHHKKNPPKDRNMIGYDAYIGKDAPNDLKVGDLVKVSMGGPNGTTVIGRAHKNHLGI